MAIVTNVVDGTTPEGKELENRGKAVKARAYGGREIERLVWEETADVVYLCTKRCFDQLSAGDGSIRPVGFPREDIVEWCGEK